MFYATLIGHPQSLQFCRNSAFCAEEKWPKQLAFFIEGEVRMPSSTSWSAHQIGDPVNEKALLNSPDRWGR